MTMLNNISSYSTTSTAIRGAFKSSLSAFGRLVHGWVAAIIAHRARQANLVILRSLSDRELKDIGLNRCDIGEGLSEAAKFRLQSQRFAR